MTPLTESHARWLLDTMMADMEAQSTLYQPTAFWRAASQSIASQLREFGFARFRSLPGPRSYFVPSYGPPGNALSAEQVAQLEHTLLASVPTGSKSHLTLTEMLSGRAWALADYRVYLAGDRTAVPPDLSDISEGTLGDPPDQLEVDGRRFSRSMLNYLHGLVFMKQVVGGVELRSVLEVGGGYGTLGEILHKSGLATTYVDVDIPPTAAVASYYLSHLDGVHLVDYRQTRDTETIRPRSGDHVVLCPWQLPKLQTEIDLLWNFISFQEMEPDVVEFYLGEGRRLGARYVLLRNLREGKERRSASRSIGVDEPVLPSHYDAFLEDYRLIETNVFPFGYRTVDGFNSELRLYERR